MKSGIANVTAPAHGKHRLTGRRDRAQAQVIGLSAVGELTAIAIGLQQPRLQLDTNGFGQRRAIAIERRQRRPVGGGAGARHFLTHRIIIAQVQLEQQWAQREALKDQGSQHHAKGDEDDQISMREG